MVVVVVGLGSAPALFSADVGSLRVDDWHRSERRRGRMGRWQRVWGEMLVMVSSKVCVGVVLNGWALIG